MQKIITFFLVKITLLFLFLSCGGNDATPQMNEPNQVGEWEGTKTLIIYTDDFDTTYHDSSQVSLILNADGTGEYNDKIIEEWIFNDTVNTMYIDFQTPGIILTNVGVNEEDYQEWWYLGINATTFDRRSEIHRLNRK